MKPPVEAPTSRQSRPATSIPSAVERVLELDPAARDEARTLVDDELGVAARPAGSAQRTGPSRPIRTSPARTAPAAAVREREAALGEQAVGANAGGHERKGNR